MSNRGGSFWARLDWWGKLEVLGIGVILAYAALSVIDPVLARSLLNSLTDPAKAFFESLG
jgi:hypothetical protein